MRKTLALAATAVLSLGLSIAPASAVIGIPGGEPGETDTLKPTPAQQAKRAVNTAKKPMVEFTKVHDRIPTRAEGQRMIKIAVKNKKVRVRYRASKTGFCVIGRHVNQKTARLWVYDSAVNKTFRTRATNPKVKRAGACKTHFDRVELVRYREMTRTAAIELSFALESIYANKAAFPKTVPARLAKRLPKGVTVEQYKATETRFSFVLRYARGPWTSYRNGVTKSALGGPAAY